jgi:transcriptional regulator with XRE-family HTH domain
MEERGGQVAHTVRWWRLNAGLTVERVAERAQVSRGSVLKLEHGAGWPLAAVVTAIAGALSVPRDALTLTEPESPRVSLRRVREEAGLTVRELAVGCGVPIRSVERAEDGGAISPHLAKAISDRLGIRVTDWYPGHRERVPCG